MRVNPSNFDDPSKMPINRLKGYFAQPVKTMSRMNLWFNNLRKGLMTENPNLKRKQLYGQAVDIRETVNPKILFVRASDFAKEMLDKLERQGYLNKDIIFQGCTAKGVLTLLLEETIKNAIEVAAKKWKGMGYVGAEIGVVSFIENNELWVRILDNGTGFNEEVLKSAGRKSLTNKQAQKDYFKFEDSVKEHLFKMGQTATLLGWRLVVENRKDSQGGSVSVVLPLRGRKRTLH